METLVYYSRNRNNPPFEVTIVSDNRTVYINCNCPLGIEKKFCRHIINAIRGDKQAGSVLTSDAVISRLRTLFNNRSILRQFMEKEWQKLRIYAYENPNNKEEISEVRKIIGEAFANGFENDFDQHYEQKEDGSFAGSISQTEPNIWINTKLTTDKEKERGPRQDHIYILHKWPKEG